MCQREKPDTIEKRPLESNSLNPEFRILTRLPLRCLPESLGAIPESFGDILQSPGYIPECGHPSAL